MLYIQYSFYRSTVPSKRTKLFSLDAKGVEGTTRDSANGAPSITIVRPVGVLA